MVRKYKFTKKFNGRPKILEDTELLIETHDGVDYVMDGIYGLFELDGDMSKEYGIVVERLWQEVIIIAKTDLTLKLEKDIYNETYKQGVFGCFEVTVGWWGKERVDFLTYDTKGIWRCYEIKVSKSDFHSAAKVTFVGHYNYYVMTSELYEQVKDEIPNHIGVYCGSSLVKKAKKQELKVEEKILKDSMIRSLSRENEKFMKTCDNTYLNRLKSTISRLEKDNNEYKRERISFSHIVRELSERYGLNYKEVREFVRDRIQGDRNESKTCKRNKNLFKNDESFW